MALPSAAEPLRLAFLATELGRDGPGLLLRDITRAESADIQATLAAIVQVAPDVIVLSGIDFDHQGHTLSAFQAALNTAGHALPYAFSRAPNQGLRTGLDMDGDGRVGEARDAQSYGTFPGSEGLAVLSSIPLDLVADHTEMLWQDAAFADPPVHTTGAAFPSEAAYGKQRLVETAHWHIEVAGLTLVALSAAPPVFDGPEDRNGRRNADELKLVRFSLATDLTRIFLWWSSARLIRIRLMARDDGRR